MTQFSNVPPMSGMQTGFDQPPKTSGMAIASLVLGILGLCTAGLGSLVGIPLGIMAFSGINKQPNRLTGKGLAIAGIIVSSCTLVFGCLTFGVGLFLPALAQARLTAMTLKDKTALQMIGQHVQTHSNIHNDAFPPPSDWVSALSKDGADITPLTLSTVKPDDGRAYAMNANLSGKKFRDVRDPGRTVLLFEAAAGSPLSGTSELLAARPRTRAGYLICFVDGHTELVRPDGMGRLVWEP